MVNIWNQQQFSIVLANFFKRNRDIHSEKRRKYEM